MNLVVTVIFRAILFYVGIWALYFMLAGVHDSLGEAFKKYETPKPGPSGYFHT